MLHISVSFTIVNTRPLLMDLYQHFTPQYAACWIDIGILLGLSWDVLETIKDGYEPSAIDCCNAMLEKWLQIDPSASWRKLFIAIESLGVAGHAPDKGMYSSCI